jgi:hypothetical protein
MHCCYTQFLIRVKPSIIWKAGSSCKGKEIRRATAYIIWTNDDSHVRLSDKRTIYWVLTPNANELSRAIERFWIMIQAPIYFTTLKLWIIPKTWETIFRPAWSPWYWRLDLFLQTRTGKHLLAMANNANWTCFRSATLMLHAWDYRSKKVR